MTRSKRLVTKKKTSSSAVERLAALYIQARAALIHAGRRLHDDVGSSLSAAGLQLQLLRMDQPAAHARIDETLQILEQALSRVRDLSDGLCPSPVYRGGLKQALLRLEGQYSSGRCDVEVAYFATAAVPPEVGVGLYDAVGAAVEQACGRGATRVRVTVRGKSSLQVRIADNGRKAGLARRLSIARLLARQQGLKFECATGKSTIVSIRYGVRRTPRG